MYAIAKPRRVRSSRRGAGVEEYRVRVVPRPALPVCRAFNESRPAELVLPRLVNGDFVLLCAPDQLDERLARIRTHGLAHLSDVTQLVADAN